MIQVQNLTKRFDGCTALDKVSCSIPDGCIYGMVGSNGAGKSTFLRVLTGIYKSDSGAVTLDGQSPWENPQVKQQMMLVPDELYFLPGATLLRIAKFYENLFPTFDYDRFQQLVIAFGLPAGQPMSNFSKGMKRHAAILLTLSARPRVMLFDETFDGLDPMVRKSVKSLICNDVAERNATAIITSHSLRELEDTCDHLLFLHKGEVVLQSEVTDLKADVFKVQVAFGNDFSVELFDDLDSVSFSQSGSVANLIVRGEPDEIRSKILAKNPLLCEILPLTLEEVFLYQMTDMGYDFSGVWEGMSHD